MRKLKELILNIIQTFEFERANAITRLVQTNDR